MIWLKRRVTSAIGRIRFAWRKRVAVWRLRWWCLRRRISWTPDPHGGDGAGRR